jgi:hypothetical protein
MDAELEARTANALARLDAAPGFRLTCPSCGHSDAVPHDPLRRMYVCDQCGCRTACGVEMPRLFVLHPADRRFLTLRLASGKPNPKAPGTYERDVSVTLERSFAAGFAIDLLSGADPGLFQEFLAFVAAKRIVEDRGTNVAPDGATVVDPARPADGVTLDEAALG